MKRITAKLTLAAAMAAILLAPGQISGADVVDKGMAELLEMETLTIVYPSSPSSLKDRNRISAEKRAAFLSAATGVVTHVVSDSEASGDDLKDHLLLLGWGNRLFQNHDLHPPYGRSSVSVRFLDYVKEDPDLDLAFKCLSPFAPESEPRYLFFWSRIDQDRDRFMPVPGVGSDWAFYRHYAEVVQGMLDRTQAWPPKRDLIAEKLDDSDIEAYIQDCETLESGPLRVIFNPNWVDRETAAAVLKTRRSAHDKVVAALGDPGPDFRVALYLYLDNESKGTLTGVKAGSHSVPSAGEMHMTVRYATSPGINEDVHPVAERLMGPTASTAVYEGLPYAVEPVLLGKPLTYYAAMMLDGNRMPAIADLLDEERFRKLPNAERLAASGLFMTWLREVAGLPKIKVWYTSLDPTAERLAAELQIDPGKLEQRFRQWLTERATGHSSDVLFMAALKEAQNHYLNGDQEQAADALTRALSHKPEDRQTRFNLAKARMKTGNYEGAAAELLRVLEIGADDTGGLTAHTCLELGRVYDLLGRRDEALEEYRRVLEMPDRHNSHLSAREGLETPFTADRL